MKPDGILPGDVVRIVTDSEGSGRFLAWRCAGCKELHFIRVRGPKKKGQPFWAWNGSTRAPTISPSILKHGHPTTPDFPGADKRCHSFVTDGVVRFLGDCEHELAGQSVAMTVEGAEDG